MAKRPMKGLFGGKRAAKSAAPDPGFNLLKGLKAAAPARSAPKPGRASVAGYRGMPSLKKGIMP